MGGTSQARGRAHKVVNSADDSAVGRTLRHILEHALKAGASDVHLEPRGGYGVVRVRTSGNLQTVTKLPGSGLREVTAELKRLVGLDVSQRQAPQLGHSSLSVGRQVREVQVSSVPALDGERLTLHFIDNNIGVPTLEQLGYWGQALITITRALAQPHGLIVVAGTDRVSTALTLASMVEGLNNSALHVAWIGSASTLRLPGVTQLMVRPEIGLTAARQLRAAVRRGANVIVVEAVSDPAAARAVVQLAQHHLVLIGMHGQDAAEGLLGVVHLSKEPTLLAQNLLIAVGQQLVPRLCPECREAYKPDRELGQQLARRFDLPRLYELEQTALHERLGTHPDQFSANRPSSSPTHVIHLWRATAGGCSACSRTGYKNRIAIHEVLTPTTKLQAALTRSFTATDIRKFAGRSTIPLAQDAAVKALRGLISIEIALTFIAT